MTDLHCLFLNHKGEGYVGAPSTQHGFEMEVAKLCDCKFAGEGWKDHKDGESLDETVKRVMPDADLVIDQDNALHIKKPLNRKYKIGLFLTDLHAKHHYNINNPLGFSQMLNNTAYDVVFMRYEKLHGTKYRPECFWDWIECEKRWLPWSVDVNYYTPKVKKTDVAFIGITDSCYPLRNSIWEGLYYTARGYKVLREAAPRGKTYERTVKSLKQTHLVGEKYRDALAQSKILLFGCSIYRYPLQKFFEASACGCLVMSNQPASAYSLGFMDRKTYVEVEETSWESELLYYLENEGEAKQIARNGLKNTLMNHSHQNRAQQFIKQVEEII